MCVCVYDTISHHCMQVGNFYGASNDEYSQPRHCWDPSGKYIYGVSLQLLIGYVYMLAQ